MTEGKVDKDHDGQAPHNYGCRTGDAYCRSKGGNDKTSLNRMVTGEMTYQITSMPSLNVFILENLGINDSTLLRLGFLRRLAEGRKWAACSRARMPSTMPHPPALDIT